MVMNMAKTIPLGQALDRRLRAALKEDAAKRDITSLRLIPPCRIGRVEFIAHEKGVLCGIQIAGRCFTLMDKRAQFKALLSDGAKVEEGSVIATVEGKLRALLASERLALNLLCHLSGIATLTSRFVEKVREFGTQIYDTRKTTPLWRDLEKYAVRIGGGHNHRFDLSEAYFIKDNHIDACGGIKTALEALFQKKKDRRSVIVETRTARDAKLASRYPVDVILLDNMKPVDIKKVRKKVTAGAILEISGGVTLENVKEYARTGVPRISIGAITHSMKCLDISMEFKNAI
jgi:nicotinate-nucleotide pyrophosphorylase (carboxylating)